MDKLEQQLQSKLADLSISESEKEKLLDSIRPLIREKQERLEFMQARMLKDKNIAINLLNQAIDDLRAKQEEVQEANRVLLEQKQLLEEQSLQLRENLLRLEMSYEELEQFSYIASHDLRSPLRTIGSYAQLLQRRYGRQLDEDADEFLNYITSGTKQMNDIISDLLNYSFIRDQKGSFVPIDLNKILEMVLFNLHSDIEEAKARIEVHELPREIRASKSGMLQLFQNLIGNAIKFRSIEDPQVCIHCSPEGDGWHFTVTDNGIGLDEAFSHKAFLPFQRLSDRSLPGSGIGLAICKKIVKLHGGQIWYESRPGAGTIFHFTILP